MAISWKYPSGYSSYVGMGLDWYSTQTDSSVSIAQRVYRWDKYTTDNYGGKWSESLTLPDGTTQTWSNLSFGSGKGTRQLDSFTTRTYARKKAAYTITHSISTNQLGTIVDSGGGYEFRTVGNPSFSWTLTVPALPSYAVTYDANGGEGEISSQTKWYGEALTLASSGFTRPYYTLAGWATSQTGAVVYELGASYTGNSALALYAKWLLDAPADITSATVTRNSDTSATISWVPGTGYETTYSRVYIEQSVDGGDWESVTYIAGTSTSYNATASANHSYQFRVRAWNNGNGEQWSNYATTGTIYNTPSAPTSVTGARYGTGTSVQLTIQNDALTATGFDVEYSADQSTWTAATVASSTGTPVTEAIIDNMGGSYYFRVRNTRGSLVSAWTVSGLVITITPPNPPTLVSPTSGAAIGSTTASKSVSFQWQHNPIDGSSQTAYELRYRRSTASSWTTVSGTTAQSRSVSLSRGYSYVWQVRTKGAAADYGEWSGTQTFSVLQPPTIGLTLAPLDGSSNIEGMPITYTVSYLDNAGTFAAGTIAIQLNGQTLYSESLPATATTVGTSSNITGTITTNEFLPSSGNTYDFVVTVRSSDTLTATLTKAQSVQMGEPYHGTLDITNDPETGYVLLIVGWDSSTGAQPAQYATLYRVTSEGRVLLGDNLSNGAGVQDKYAPLNTDYYYEVVTHAASTAVFTVQFTNRIETSRWFVYYGNNLAWARWNPSGNYSLSRPEKKRVHYAGRKWPLSYDSLAMEQSHSMSWTVLSIDDEEWANGFIHLMNDGGRGIYKSVDGWVFRADFEYTETPNYTSATHMGQISLTITRIDGDVL